MLVVVLCGFWPHAITEAARRLLNDHPTLHLLQYRAARTGAGEIPLGGDLVRDLTAALGEHGRDLLVLMPETYEPDQIRTAWRAHAPAARLSVTTVVPADLVLDGLTDATALRSVGLHQHAGDDRSVADLVARQIEQADTLLPTGSPDGDDEWEAEQIRVLLHRIAPWVGHRSPAGTRLPEGTRTTEPVTPVLRGLRGRAVGAHEPLPSHGVTACVFRARRPLHPGRLHGALDDLTERVLRSRGHFWLASRPGVVMTWESAAGLTIGPACGWLADQPDEHWHAADPERRLAADLDWDPYYGDRHHHLAFVGIDLDPVRIHRILAGCLLTDEELSRGESAWRLLPDPFRRADPAPAAGHTPDPQDLRSK